MKRTERGVTLPILAFSLIALLAMAALVVDGARGYAERRQMQNAADAAALAGAGALNDYLQGDAGATDIDTTARATAVENGVDAADVVCRLVRAGGSAVTCPTASGGGSVPSDAYRVRVLVEHEVPTAFAGVIGVSEIGASGSAAAAIQAVRAGSAPFLICATDDQQPLPLLLDQGGDPTTWPINTAALEENGGPLYDLWGNDIKVTDCGNPSSSFRGEVTEGTYSLPGLWQVDTGNSNGPVLTKMRRHCAQADIDGGTCVIAVPLCYAGNGQSGAGFAMYCSRMAGFRITNVANHDIDGYFVGEITLADVPSSGPPVPGEARVIRLVE